MNFSTLSWRLLAAVLVTGVVLVVDGLQRPSAPPPAQAVWPANLPLLNIDRLQLVAQGPMPMPPDAPAAHASTLLAMPPGQAAAITAFWFSGERESGPDVQIAASQWSRTTRQWEPARTVVNRHSLGEQLGFGVRRLGNPVAWLDSSGRVHLFVVATGWGGWAASRIAHLRQSSTGNGLQDLEFEPVRVMPLSWLWNTSHLVRNAPLPLSDGGMVLPVHFELGIKYPVALRFDRNGDLLGMHRISQKNYALQPTMLARTSTDWLALMRDERPNGRIIAAQTQDGGRTWADLSDLDLVNPDSSVGGVALAPGQLVLAHNSSPGSRAFLNLSGSADGLAWRPIQVMEHGAEEDEYSYPAMAWVDDSLWVSYTVDRQRIAWQRFKVRTRP
jgi:predicted neuraminidase